MPWTARFFQDTAEMGLGTMRAEFADDTGTVIARHEQRMKIGDDSQAGIFIETAQAILKKTQERMAADAEQQTLAGQLAAKLNG